MLHLHFAYLLQIMLYNNYAVMQPFFPNDSKQMNKTLGIREKQP